MPLPLTNPVLIVTLTLLVFFLAPLLSERLRLPGIIGLIIAGAIVGPNALGWLERDATFRLLGTVGLLYIMFIAGLELDLATFIRQRRRTLVFGALTFFIPQTLGMLMGVYVLGFDWVTSILLASMFASHTLLAYPVVSRLGIVKDPAVTTAVGGTIITDTAALLVLAVIAASVQGELTGFFWLRLFVSLGLFAFGIFWGLPKLGRWVFRHISRERTAEFLFVLSAMMASAYLAELAGVEGIIGAFFAGLALNRLIPEGSLLMNRIIFVGNAIFIPFFLFSVGMLMDLRILAAEPSAIIIAVAMVVTVVLTKYLAALLTQLLFGFTSAQGWVIFGLSVGQAAATLAAVLVGFNIGLFSEAVLNGAILMILVTVILGPYAAQRYGRTVALAQTRPLETTDSPQRILVPLANPSTAEALLDLAAMLRDHDTHEPIYPMTVVPGGKDTTVQVAQAERMLAHAIVYAAGLELPTIPLIRVSTNPANGIFRAISEGRISDTIIGWNGQPSASQRLFGGVIDKLLERSDSLIMVARLQAPLMSARRLRVLMPAWSAYDAGFYGVSVRIKRLAKGLNLPLELYLLGEKEGISSERFRLAKPEHPLALERQLSWVDVPELLESLHSDDLVVLLGAREGALAWSPPLERVPQDLGALGSSFLVFYPSQERPQPLLRTLADLLTPERVLFNLPDVALAEVVWRLLAPSFPLEVAQRLQAQFTQPGVAQEKLPGALVLHGHSAEIATPMLFLAFSSAGISLQGRRLYLLALLISPEELPSERHLRSLGALGGFIASEGETFLRSERFSEVIHTLQAGATLPEANEAVDA